MARTVQPDLRRKAKAEVAERMKRIIPMWQNGFGISTIACKLSLMRQDVQETVRKFNEANYGNSR